MGRMTIREVANHFGTSKNTISYRIKKLPTEMIERDGNKMYVLDAGIEELAKGFSLDKSLENHKETILNHDKSLDKSVNDQTDLIKVLTDQIEDLKRDKEKLNDRITDLAISIHNLETLLNKQIDINATLRITAKSEPIEIEPEQIKPDPAQKPKGFWSFLKRSKKVEA